MIAIIDYGAGNQTSVKRALDFLQIPSGITDNPADLENARGIIFPGVGSASQAMPVLIETGFARALENAALKNIPILGICLGAQIMLAHSDENDTACLGLLPGICKKFPPDLREEDGSQLKIPHMGWNRVKMKGDCCLWNDMPKDAEFYFVHSYYNAPEPSLVLGTTDYGREFCSVYGRDGLWGAQFHPEKSGRPGLRFLKNFHDYCRSH